MQKNLISVVKSALVVSALSFLISACGGGSGTLPVVASTSPVPVQPPVSIPSAPSIPVLSPPRSIVDWNAVEAPKPWDYKAVYPSRSACLQGEGKVFEVGPNKEYTSLKAVPWLSLIPCDQVNIHYTPASYKDIVVLTSRGRANKWITIRGIPGPNGELPILEANGAVMPKGTGANSWTETRGMITISKPDQALIARAGLYNPGYLHITGLKIQNARPPAVVTKMSGAVVPWDKFSAGIYIAVGEQIAVTDCELADNGLGLFANSGGGEYSQTRNLLVRGNYFHGNSNVGSYHEHNAYTEGIGTVYEYNYFGAPVAGTSGDNIKDRSAGVVFRYNYIEGGANLIALRDPESNRDYERVQIDAWGEKLVNSAYVYSNTFVVKNYGESIIGHGDGIYNLNQVREGALHFYNNRVISIVDNAGYWAGGSYSAVQSVPLFGMINTKPTVVYARNNLLYATSKNPGSMVAPISIFRWQGTAEFQNNWANNFTNAMEVASTASVLTVGTKFTGTGLGALVNSTADPLFVDFKSGNYLTRQESPYNKQISTLHGEVIKRGLIPVSDPVTAPRQSIK